MFAFSTLLGAGHPVSASDSGKDNQVTVRSDAFRRIDG